MTRDELLEVLEVERRDMTWWRLPPAPTTPSSERMRQAIADADELAVQQRRRDALAAMDTHSVVDTTVDGRGYRQDSENLDQQRSA